MILNWFGVWNAVFSLKILKAAILSSVYVILQFVVNVGANVKANMDFLSMIASILKLIKLI